jgi:hypothetical protein
MAADTAKIESGSGSRQPSIGGGPTTAAATDATIKPRIAKHGYIRFLTLRNLDGRSRAVAKCNSLVASFEGDLGGRENLTAAQAQLVQRAAFLAVMCEDFEVRYTLGEPIELADRPSMCSIGSSPRSGSSARRARSPKPSRLGSTWRRAMPPM